MNDPQTWYIIKRPEGNCEIVPSNQLAEDNDPSVSQRWGPFTSQSDALARRVGLIRSGKCEPV